MSVSTVNKRVLRDINVGRINLEKEFGILLQPEEKDYYRVHFVFPGPEDTPYQGGLYHGMIRLNPAHPNAPPNIHMVTPSGRFQHESCPIPGDSRGLCTTTSSFHPETWNMLNDLEKVIKGLLSLMCEPFDGAIGSLDTTDNHKRSLALKSHLAIMNDKVIKELFPELHQKLMNGTYVPVNLTALTVAKPVEQKKIEAAKQIESTESTDSSEDCSDSSEYFSSGSSEKSSSSSLSESSDGSSSDSSEESQEKPVKKSTKNPAKKPVKTSTKKPTEKPVKKPAKKSTEKSVKKPSKKPSEKSTKKSSEKSVKKASEKSTKKPSKK